MLSDREKLELIQNISNYLSSKITTFDISEHSDISFSRLGLDSMGHVELSAVIEKSVGLEVSPEFAFNYPTLNAIVKQMDLESQTV